MADKEKVEEFPSGHEYEVLDFRHIGEAMVVVNQLRKKGFRVIPLLNNKLLVAEKDAAEVKKILKDVDYDWDETDIKMGKVKVAEAGKVPGWDYDRWENEVDTGVYTNDRFITTEKESACDEDKVVRAFLASGGRPSLETYVKEGPPKTRTYTKREKHEDY